jgi:hypothetical protein
MFKQLSMLALAAVTSAALIVPAQADPCDDDALVGTGVGAVVGAGIGAAINRGNDTGAAIGGAIIGGIIGNAAARDRCEDDHRDAYYYQPRQYDAVYRGRPSSWHNPYTGARGGFRVLRTYDDWGYWDDGRWYAVDYTEYKRHKRRYDAVECREYVEYYEGPRGDWERTHIVCEDGSEWRRIS